MNTASSPPESSDLEQAHAAVRAATEALHAAVEHPAKTPADFEALAVAYARRATAWRDLAEVSTSLHGNYYLALLLCAQQDDQAAREWRREATDAR